MRFPAGRAMAQQPLFLFLLFLILVTARVSADDPTTGDKNNNAPTVTNKATDGEPTGTDLPTIGPTTANDATATNAKTTDPPSTTIDDSTTVSASTDPTTATTASTSSDSTTSTMDTTTADTTSMTTTAFSTSTTDSTTSTTSSSTSSADLIPTVTVPPTADAPYMQKSSTPEGTVFIAVGAALGIIGLSVLAWRALVAWSVNRSVKRAAVLHSSEAKGLLRSKKKRRSHRRSSGGPGMSLNTLGKSHRHSHTSTRMPRSNSGLFFSPTAGAGGMQGGGKRGSNYLPAGYYAAGTAAAGGGGAASTFTSMGPKSQGYTRTRSAPSPPSSPTLPSSSVDVSYNSGHSLAGPSTSSVNLASPPSQVRAPSAYLEDLFESHAPPSDYSGHR